MQFCSHRRNVVSLSIQQQKGTLMQILNFVALSSNSRVRRFAVINHANPETRIAELTLNGRDGTIAVPGRALTVRELDGISAFIHD
jgi:hypothetical protein